MLLAPVAEQLGTKRLVIVADGALQYVPFAALPAPSATASLVTGHLPLAGKDAKGKGLMTKDNPLILEHEIVNLPSASTLAVMRRELKGRASAPKLVAVLADPVFDINDVRLRRAAKEITGSEKTIDNDVNSKLVRSIKETGLANGEWPLPRLLGTRREATAILALAPESKRRRALDFEANRDVVTGSDIGQYQIIHFATHGLLNSRNPELSGIVLSLVDSQGRAQDGFLRLHEIYNLRLSAELVVLSACQTGLGKEIRGEGLIGLTRGFMYAGARRLVTSLWQVDDKATSELMMRFYRGMFERKLTAAAALRAAQIEMWQQKDWQSPYYWASFALQGEWR
jgi:CHAT domain-containing protein